MENEDLVSVSQVNDEFTLISLFFRADIVVKLVILILFAFYLILIRIRLRLLIIYPKIYECQYCDSSSKLKRIQKKFKHRIIHFVFRLRVYYYQCQDCYKKQLIILTKK